MTERQLVKKLSEVMKEVKYIQKKGFNAFHKYKYATESDVAEKIREVLAERNVMLIPNMTAHTVREHTNAKGKTEYIVTVDMEFKFYDGDTGEEITFNMAGEGQDAGDKAIYKAITGAQKYALMKVFMIPTGDDPEADNEVDERNHDSQPPQAKPISQKQVGLIKVKVKNLAMARQTTDEEVYKHLNVPDITKLTSQQASKAIETLTRWEEQMGA